MANNKRRIGSTKNGYEVYSIVNNQHMLAHPVAEGDLWDAMCEIELKPPFGFYTVDLEEPVGFTNCVKTTESDDVRLECRAGRELPSRMVYGRTKEVTSLVTVGICTDDDGLETIFTAFYGELAPKELSDPRLSDEERPEAEAFWANHALVAQEEPGPMDLEFKEHEAYCSVSIRINGIEADAEHFGDKSFALSGTEDDPRCTCEWESSDPNPGICAKYNISEAQFREIADKIEKALEPFERCCWCY